MEYYTLHDILVEFENNFIKTNQPECFSTFLHENFVKCYDAELTFIGYERSANHGQE